MAGAHLLLYFDLDLRRVAFVLAGIQGVAVAHHFVGFHLRGVVLLAH